MHDRTFLPYLVERTNTRNTLNRAKTLESIPEHVGEEFEDDTSSPSSTAGDTNESESEWKFSTAIHLPQLVNKSQHERADTPSRLSHGNQKPRGNSFLNVANMPLSSRGNTEKLKRLGDMKRANYLIYEPTVAGHAIAKNNIPRYAFRTTLDRIPETEGEKLLSAHGKRESYGGEKTKQISGLTEKSSDAGKKEGVEMSVDLKESFYLGVKNYPQEAKKMAKVSPLTSGNKNKGTTLTNLDLYAQQRGQIALKGPPTRVAFSYKMIQNSLHSREPPDKLQHLSAEDVAFPRVVMYQWEVHEKPKFINSIRPRKLLKKLHRIPTGEEEQDHPSGDENKETDNLTTNVLLTDSSAFGFPQAPPPTPKCESFKELCLLRSRSPEANHSKLG